MKPPEVHALGRHAREAVRLARPALPIGTTGFTSWPSAFNPGTVVLLDSREIRAAALRAWLGAAPDEANILAIVQPGSRLEVSGIRNLMGDDAHPPPRLLASALTLWARGELPTSPHVLALRPEPAESSCTPQTLPAWTPVIEELPGPWQVLDPDAHLHPELELALRRSLWPWPAEGFGPREAAARAWHEGRWPLAWMADSLAMHLETVRRVLGPEAMARAIAFVAHHLPTDGWTVPEMDEDMLPLELADLAEEADRHDRSLLLQLVRARELAVAPLGQRLDEEGWRLRRRHLPDPTGPWRLVEDAWKAAEPRQAPSRGTRTTTSSPPAHRRHGGVIDGHWFEPILPKRPATGWGMICDGSTPASPVGGALRDTPVWARPAAEDPRRALWDQAADLREWRTDGWWLTWGEGSTLREMHLGPDESAAQTRLERVAQGHARSWWRRHP